MVTNNENTNVWRKTEQPYVPPISDFPERPEPKPLPNTPTERWTPKVPEIETIQPKTDEPVKKIVFTIGNFILTATGILFIIGIVVGVAVALNSFYGVL
jgi:hypothetical protein